MTPKFGCEVTQNGADSLWLSDPRFFGGYVTSALTIEAFAIKISRTRRLSYENIAKSEVSLICKYYGTTTTSLIIC